MEELNEKQAKMAELLEKGFYLSLFTWEDLVDRIKEEMAELLKTGLRLNLFTWKDLINSAKGEKVEIFRRLTEKVEFYDFLRELMTHWPVDDLLKILATVAAKDKNEYEDLVQELLKKIPNEHLSKVLETFVGKDKKLSYADFVRCIPTLKVWSDMLKNLVGVSYLDFVKCVPNFQTLGDCFIQGMRKQGLASLGHIEVKNPPPEAVEPAPQSEESPKGNGPPPSDAEIEEDLEELLKRQGLDKGPPGSEDPQKEGEEPQEKKKSGAYLQVMPDDEIDERISDEEKAVIIDADEGEEKE